MMKLTTALLPELVPDADLQGSTAVVIDVIRASTTITHALAAGADWVKPVLDVTDARERAAKLRAEGEAVLLGGERGGQPIAGFDLGNSPADYVPARVAGHGLVFTTTNGTRAVNRCEGVAATLLIGCFANRAALLKTLEDSERVALVCAGADRRVAREDLLLAGVVIQDLVDAQRVAPADLDDSSRAAWDSWRAVDQRRLSATLHETQGGRNLLSIGREDDIPRVAQLDSHDNVPRLLNGRLRNS